MRKQIFLVAGAAVLLVACGNDPESLAAAPPPAPPAPDTVPPTSPGTPSVVLVSPTSVNVTWSPATDNVGVIDYQVLRCMGSTCTPTTVVATVAGTTHTDAALTPGATYGYRVRALDAAGNSSMPSTKVTAALPANEPPAVADATPPSVPGNLAASLASQTTASIGWSASSDNVGVTGYRVFRCAGSACVPTAQVATTATPGYFDGGLLGGTTYAYRVAAVDAAGNASAMSATVSLTVPQPAPGGSGPPTAAGWYQVPNSRLQTVCAATNGFGQVSGAEGCFGILSWSGGAFDSKRNRLIVTGGGHNAYYGNELYALNLGDLTMTRLNNPGLPLASGCSESVANGTQPNSRHTYDGIEYMPNVDRLFVFSGSLACGSGNWGQDTWTFDFATMQWQNMRPSGTLPRGEAGMMTAYDPNTGRVYVHDRIHLYAYDFASNSYTRVSSSAVNLGYHLMATIDPKRKLFVIVGYDSSAGGGRVHTYNIGSGTATLSTWSTTGGSGIVSEMYAGLEYDPVRDRVVAWNGGNTVYSLNLDTRAWATTTMTGAPSAPSQSGRGTHGRWRYSPASDVFVLVNEYDQNAYTFRMP